jgi:hypothetical protein
MNQTKSATATSGRQAAAMNSFGLRAAARPQRNNADIARDFLELSFNMESGRPLPTLTRFEGPITVRIAGQVPGNASTDLSRLLQRFRNEAGLNISEVAAGPASINIEFVPRSAIKGVYANVACFTVPRVASWAEFKASRNNGTLNWATLTQRDRTSIFIPAESSAQEVRDCLHEETAQAMGPVNDLYRLTDSVFNDDNFNTTLTGFDMTILRAYYAPELHSGMTQGQVAAKLPAILSRINPSGNSAPPRPQAKTPRFWINTIQTALGGSGSASARANAAKQALATARAQGWNDGRLAFSYFALGRITLASDPNTAIAAFSEAGRIYRSLPGGEIHAAHVDMQLAAYALSRGEADKAIQLVDRTLPAVAAGENASLMATLMLVKSEALAMKGQRADAAAVRIDSQGWARYGFGSDAQINARAAEISALARRGNRS